MPPRFLLQTFGGLTLSVRDGGEMVLVNQRKRLALIAVLAAEGNGGMARERLFALFWPESDGERARNALNQMVFAIRRDLGDDAILSDTVAVRLDSAVIDNDLRVFREALADKRFADAIAAYRGPFLDGVFLRDTPEFERWVDDVRRALAGEYARALECEVDAALRGGSSRAADAVRFARLLAAHDPLSTQGAVRLMRALERSGDTAAALRHANLHATHVRGELSSEPGPELEREVTRLRANGTPAPPIREAVATTPAPSSEKSEDRPPSPGPIRKLSWSNRRALWASATGVAVLAVVAIVRLTSRQELDPRRVVIASFDNQTGDSTLDDFGRIAADVITEQLARAGFVDLVDPATALASSRQMRGEIARSGTQAAVRMLAKTTHARLVVTGSYFRDGDSLVAQARVTDAATNDVLAATEPAGAPLGKQDLLIQAVRQRIMGALALRVDDRLATVVPPGNTPTYEAYRAFIAGLEIFTAGRFRAAAPHFQRAYTLDTTFIEPLVWEAIALQASPKLREIVGILDRRREELSGLDRYALDYNRALLSDDLEKALGFARNASRLAPGSHWTMTVATLLFRLGRMREAVDVWSTIDLEHGWLHRNPGVWVGYIWALHDAGAHREELERAREARAMFPENTELLQAEAIALAMNHRWDDLNQRLDSLELRSPGGVATVGSELRVHGDRDRATAIFSRCVRRCDFPAPTVANAADFPIQRAHLLYDCGRWKDAALLLDSLQSDPREPAWARPQLARWLAVARIRLGDRTGAAAILDSVAKDSLSLRNGGLYDAARIAALLGDRARAVAFLQPLRNLPGNWLHYNPDAADFDSLVGYAPFERLRAGH